LALHRQLGNEQGIAQSLHGLGLIALDESDYPQVQRLGEESLSLFQQLGDHRRAGIARYLLARVAADQGNVARAVALGEENLALARAVDDKRSIAIALNFLGMLALEQGDPERATALDEESLRMSLELGDKRLVAECLGGLAGVASARGQATRAGRLHAAAAALRDALEEPLSPPDRRISERYLVMARAGLDEAAFVAAWTEGQAMSLEQAVAYAWGTQAPPDQPGDPRPCTFLLPDR
jgi:hypothetical protein